MRSTKVNRKPKQELANGNGLRVYLYGWFGYRNLGDDLLLRIMLTWLSELPCVSSIEVAVHDEGYLESLFRGNAKAFPGRKSTAQLLQAAFRSDFLIIGPGGLFPHSSAFKVIAFAAIVGFWRMIKKQTALFLFGANAKQTRVACIAWRCLKSLSTPFVSRDSGFLRSVRLRANNEVYEATDAIFLMSPDAFFDSLDAENIVAFCFANLYDIQSKAYRDFVTLCADVVSVVSQFGCKAALLSFTAGADEQLNSDIVAAASSNAVVLSYEQTIDEVHRLKKYRAVVGMRFHACALSVLGGVPLVPISYSSKTDRLLEDCGMGNNICRYCNSRKLYYGRVIPLDSNFVSAQLGSALVSPDGYVCGQDKINGLQKKARMAFGSLAHAMQKRMKS